jgi:anti-sigma B factor antagonist
MAEPLQIIESAGPREGVRIIRLIGPCTLADMFPFQTVLRAQAAPITLLDVTDVPYMDSAALGCVVRLHVACEARKTKYAIIGTPDRIKTLFRITHVDTVLIAYDTVEEALAKL